MEIGNIIILFHIISALTDLLPTSHHVEGECMCSLALDGGECSACHPGHFTPWGRGPSIHSVGEQVWTFWRTDNTLPLLGFKPQITHTIA